MAISIVLGILCVNLCWSRLVFPAWVLLLVLHLSSSRPLFIWIILARIYKHIFWEWTQRFHPIRCWGVGETHHLAITTLGFLAISLPHITWWGILWSLHRDGCELPSWWEQSVTNRSSSIGQTVSQICVLLYSGRKEPFRFVAQLLLLLLLLSF